MNAVVLAGGVRSGLEIPGSGLPRALWPFPSQPLVAHVLRFLVNSGCDAMAICANGKTRMIAAELSSGAQPWQNLHYSEDPLPRGPAGCLRDLKDWLGPQSSLCIQGTAWYDFDLPQMVQEHRRSNAAITVGAQQAPDGVLEPVGVFLIEPAILDMIPTVGYHDIKEQLIPKVIAAGLRVQAHCIKGRALLIHSPEHYLAAIRDAITLAANDLPQGYQRRTSGAIVHESASISGTARLSGPVWIDAGAVIEDNAMLLGPVIIGEKATVAAETLVRRAVVMRSATLSSGTELCGQIVGPQALYTGSAFRSRAGRSLRERGWKIWGAPAHASRTFVRA